MKFVRAIVIGLFIIGVPFSSLFADESASSTPESSSESQLEIATTTDEAATSTDTAPVLPSDTFTLTIRDGSATAFSGIVELAASTSPDVSIIPTGGGDAVPVPARSLLAELVELDAESDAFAITDLAYFSSFSSFLINCIAVSGVDEPQCFNWTYAVNGSYPQMGIDDYVLNNGDTAFLFFGPSRQVVLSTTTIASGESFTATAQNYELASGIYVGAPGLTIGVGTPNPDFTFTELATSTSDENGAALFALTATGTFSVGIQEDFYFPTVSIAVVDPAATSTPEEDEPPTLPKEEETSRGSGGGGGSSGGSSLAPVFNVPLALQFIASQQREDGSFANTLLTDWAAIAFAASDPGIPKTKLWEYLLTAAPVVSSATDYERHAMALMALAIDPYTGTPIDYISPIAAQFDGAQIGDSSLVNDDIFAIFPLLHAGYSVSDDIIVKTTSFIISRQSANGSWENSVDVTAAAVQALSMLNSLQNVGESLTKAQTYLRGQQQQNGGFGNSFSTSWTLQAIAALNESPSLWTPGGITPITYLASLQAQDGGVESAATADTRVWATEYAIPAALNNTWRSLLSNYQKPIVNEGGGGGGAAPSVATTTPDQATSTPLVLGAATTTIDIVIETTDRQEAPQLVPVLAHSRTNATTSGARATIGPPIVAVIENAHAVMPITATTSNQVAAAAAVGNSPAEIDWISLLLYLFVLLAIVYILWKAIPLAADAVHRMRNRR
ncbi:MAG: hypothetical protein UY63_C0006G0015 [Parcubacteria group bacterium GW2011_GWA2_51_10]|nr:MAG: hypothetical protein UY63_C0006G0015 [Parcubacteria group bacterium GW2011_GWA2_51_10]